MGNERWTNERRKRAEDRRSEREKDHVRICDTREREMERMLEAIFRWRGRAAYGQPSEKSEEGGEGGRGRGRREKRCKKCWSRGNGRKKSGRLYGGSGDM